MARGPDLQCTQQRDILSELPTEILHEILRLAFVPGKISVQANADKSKAILTFWTVIPARTMFLEARSVSETEGLRHRRLIPTMFAINRRIYAEVWHLLSRTSTAWHFPTVNAAWHLLASRKVIHSAVIPSKVQRAIRHISVEFRGPEKDTWTPVPSVPAASKWQGILTKLRSLTDLQVLEVALPWPDFDLGVSISKVPHWEPTPFEHRNINYETVSASIPGLFGIQVSTSLPWTDLTTTANVLADFTWQGLETRVWLWRIDISRFTKRQLSVAGKRLQLMSTIGTDYSDANDLNRYINQRKSPTFEQRGMDAVQTFFNVIDPEDVLWKNRILMACIVFAIGQKVGQHRVRFRIDLLDLEKHYEAGEKSDIKAGDMYAGLKPLLVIS